MRIMIAVDASRHSEAAVAFLTRMRWPPGSRMVVVSVVPLPFPLAVPATLPAAALAMEPNVLAARAEAASQTQATIAQAETVLRTAGFSAEGRLLEGDPREAIPAAAHEEHADLLVLGSHGRTGLARLLLGSVSSHVVTHASCSVLVVKVPGAR